MEDLFIAVLIPVYVTLFHNSSHAKIVLLLIYFSFSSAMLLEPTAGFQQPTESLALQIRTRNFPEKLGNLKISD